MVNVPAVSVGDAVNVVVPVLPLNALVPVIVSAPVTVVVEPLALSVPVSATGPATVTVPLPAFSVPSIDIDVVLLNAKPAEDSVIVPPDEMVTSRRAAVPPVIDAVPVFSRPPTERVFAKCWVPEEPSKVPLTATGSLNVAVPVPALRAPATVRVAEFEKVKPAEDNVIVPPGLIVMSFLVPPPPVPVIVAVPTLIEPLTLSGPLKVSVSVETPL